MVDVRNALFVAKCMKWRATSLGFISTRMCGHHILEKAWLNPRKKQLKTEDPSLLDED